MTQIRTPAQVQPFVDVLGIDGAIDFLLEFGGAELYLPKTPTARSRVAQAVGLDKARILAVAAEQLPARVPLAKAWIAKVWYYRPSAEKRLSVAEIARRLHTTDVTVRKYLRSEDLPVADPDQPTLPLFEQP